MSQPRKHVDHSITYEQAERGKRHGVEASVDAIRTAVGDSGKTRYWLAQRMGVHQAFVTRLTSESIKTNPTVETLGLIAEALDCDLVISFQPRHHNGDEAGA